MTTEGGKMSKNFFSIFLIFLIGLVGLMSKHVILTEKEVFDQFVYVRTINPSEKNEKELSCCTLFSPF